MTDQRDINMGARVYPRAIEVRSLSNFGAWHTLAACRGRDQNLFFPDRGGSARQAKAVCRGCGVREACLDFGLGMAEGIWGGFSEKERERERMRRRKGLPASYEMRPDQLSEMPVSGLCGGETLVQP